MSRDAMESAAAPGITVVLCTFNGARYLTEQLRSLLAQTRRPDELVILDDVSDDDTWTLLEAFRNEAEIAGINVLLQRNPRNLGYVRNFERGVALARTGLVLLCDQDDVWHPGKIARIEAEFRARPALQLLHTDARLVDAGGAALGCGLFEALELTARERALIHAGRAFEVLMRRNVVTGATAAFRRGLVARALPFPDGWVHDEWLALVAAAGGEVDCLEEPLVDYRQHGANQIGMNRRSVAEKLGRHGVPRRVYLRRVAGRLVQLQANLERGGVPMDAPNQRVLREALAHARHRAELPRAPLARWLRVGREVLSGRYARCSFGLRSIGADLLGLD